MQIMSDLIFAIPHDGDRNFAPSPELVVLSKRIVALRNSFLIAAPYRNCSLGLRFLQAPPLLALTPQSWIVEPERRPRGLWCLRTEGTSCSDYFEKRRKRGETRRKLGVNPVLVLAKNFSF